MGSNKQAVQQLVDEMRRLGATVITRNHHKVYYKGRLVGSIPGSPSDYHSLANTRNRIIRAIRSLDQ